MNVLKTQGQASVAECRMQRRPYNLVYRIYIARRQAVGMLEHIPFSIVDQERTGLKRL